MINNQLQLTVVLYLLGDALDPEVVTKVLGIQPTRAHKRGQEFLTNSGREFATKTGLWSIAVQSESISLDEHLAVLLNTLTGRKGIDAIPGVEDAYVDVFIAVASDKDGDAKCALSVETAALEGLANLGLPLRISMTAGLE